MNKDGSSDQARRNAAFLAAIGDWHAARDDAHAHAGWLDGVKRDALQLEALCEAFKTDEPSRQIVAQATLVAATFRGLRARSLSGEDAVQVLVQALSGWVLANAEDYTFARLGISRDKPEEAFAQARANFKSRGEARFGSHFLYEQEVSDASRSIVNIRRCLYNDLLRHLQLPEVTQVFCAMDTIWAAEATRQGYNLGFQRPTTLARGDDKCSFQFFKVES